MSGSFFAMISALSGVVMLLVVGAVVVFVLVRVAGAGGAGRSVGSMTDPIPGTLLVTAAAMPSRRAVYHMTRLTGVISAEGIDPVAAQYHGLIRTSKWPSPGESLPVIVDRADPRRFAIEWDKVGGSGDEALKRAQALAAVMRERNEPR